MFIIFCLLFLCLLKFLFFLKYCKYVIVSGVSYGGWNSLSVTLFANKHGYTNSKEWRQKATLFRLQKEARCLKWTNSNLDAAMLKKFWFQLLSIVYNVSNHCSCVWLFCMRKSSTPPVIFNICGLKCMTTMFIDNKAALLLLIMPMIHFRGCKVT